MKGFASPLCGLFWLRRSYFLLAWVCTEAVRTQSRELVLGKSLSEFMRTLGMEPVGGGATGARTRLRNQLRRLFNAHVRLIHEHEHGEQFISSAIADRGEFWWNERQPDEPVLFDSKIRLGEDFFNEIIHHPVPIDMNTLTALKRCALGLDLYLWLVYRTFALTRPVSAAGYQREPESVNLSAGLGQPQVSVNRSTSSW